MSSDADYLAFLDKANAQREAGASQALSQPAEAEAIRIETVETGVRVPEVLTSISEYYISETDEPFEPVALRWPGAARGIWPEADQFAALVTGSSPSTSVATSELSRSVETLSVSAFDPKNRYAPVVRAVRAARAASSGSDAVSESDVDIKVYRMELSSSRVQYWILALDAEEGSIVGLRAKAIES